MTCDRKGNINLSFSQWAFLLQKHQLLIGKLGNWKILLKFVNFYYYCYLQKSHKDQNVQITNFHVAFSLLVASDYRSYVESIVNICHNAENKNRFLGFTNFYSIIFDENHKSRFNFNRHNVISSNSILSNVFKST